jgi:regulator of sigma E protease
VSVLYFLLLIGVLVLIHELGHFTAAKLLDFRVERFSLGFGRPLVRIRAGETEYQLGIVPLGGYVRIAGEDPEDRDPERETEGRSFDAKPVWQRLIVVFAGPLANLVLPVIIYFSLFIGHTELPAAVIGDVIEASPAHHAGIRAGDQVIAIDGDEVRYWEEVERAVASGLDRELKLKIKRGGKTFERYIEPSAVTRRGPDGRVVRVGAIGITHAPFLPQVGVVESSSLAARSGLESGDTVIAIDGRRIDSVEDLEGSLAGLRRRSGRMHMSALRPEPALPGIDLLGAESIEVFVNAGAGLGEGDDPLVAFGLVASDLVVQEVDAGSPAAAIGLTPGAVIESAGGKPVAHWRELERRLETRGVEPIELVWRDGSGERRRGELVQRLESVPDEFGQASEILVFGARSHYARGRGATLPIQDRFRYAARKGFERTGEAISVVGSAFWSILRGRNPADELGGPIVVYRAAAVSGQRGWVSFLLIIALISISVALINILPIPVLDGGHLLIFALEAIRGKRLSKRALSRLTIAGYTIVGGFTALAIGSDVFRFLVQ